MIPCCQMYNIRGVDDSAAYRGVVPDMLPLGCYVDARPRGTSRELTAGGGLTLYVVGIACYAPGETRTPNLLIRSQMLYPIELRAPIRLSFCSETTGSTDVSGRVLLSPNAASTV